MKLRPVRKKKKVEGTCICCKSIGGNEALRTFFDFKGTYSYSQMPARPHSYILGDGKGERVLVTNSEFKEFFVPIIDS